MSTVEIILAVFATIAVTVQQYQIHILNRRCDGLRALTLAWTHDPWSGEKLFNDNKAQFGIEDTAGHDPA